MALITASVVYHWYGIRLRLTSQQFLAMPDNLVCIWILFKEPHLDSSVPFLLL